MKFAMLFLALLMSVLAVDIKVLHKPDDCPPGKILKKGDNIKVHYRGTLPDGTEFDSSYKRNSPFQFKLGAGQVIVGWDKGLEGACIGEKRHLTIPADEGYGSRGVPGVIPANSPLHFHVEVMGKN